ncbi:MAG: hypothetical protein R3C44_02865 [Chloroflexota bacterium]
MNALVAAYAYQRTIAGWENIMAARVREGAGSLDRSDDKAMRDGLVGLR